MCKKYEVAVILGSDAHISVEIAEYGYDMQLLAETEFPEGLIMNTDVERFKQYIGK